MIKVLFICLVGFIFLSFACDSRGASTTPIVPATTPTAAKESPEQFIFGQKGKIVVALLGIEGCPGTKAGTDVLAELSKESLKDAVFARLDVPMEVGNPSFNPVTDWKYSYYQSVDTDRKVANRLEFFYYPTLYIIDRDGEVRYSGGCDKEKVKSMISEISAEKAGEQKKIYTSPMLAVGELAPVFQTKNLKDEDVDFQQLLAKGPVLLFFTSVGCPFSKEAAQKTPNLEKEFAGKDFTIVMIEKGSDSEAVNSMYKEMSFNGIVVLDKDNAISQKYNVEPVPFYFTIDKDGKISARGPYTELSAKQALGKLLGVEFTPSNEKPTSGAG
jgi:peroxiredoxin